MSGAEFVGGPWDGRLYAFPSAEPPVRVVLAQLAAPFPWPPGAEAPGPLPPFTRLVYRRQVSPRDDGPLWQMVYDGTAQ